MSSEVWYRKWRPQRFSDINGQEHVTRTLANAVAQGRVAHAYLLCGPRGTGKTTTARILAKAVNCQQPKNGEPCDSCESCRAVLEARALDLVEMDAASNRGIDDIRNLRDRVGYHPTQGQYRVYLIDEVHELTAQAFDALLKTLEEPPPHIIFVLATTDAHRVPATIISRCQRFDLTRIKHTDITDRLAYIAAQEAVQAEPEALSVVARAANGGLRDAVNLFEQLVATFGPNLNEQQARQGLGLISDDRARELAVLAAKGMLAEGLAVICAVQDDGVEMRPFHREVLAQLRALLLVKAGVVSGLEDFAADALDSLRREAAALETPQIVRALRAFTAVEFRGEPQPSLPLELALAEAALRPEPLAVVERPAAATAPERSLPQSPTATPPRRDLAPTGPAAAASSPAARSGDRPPPGLPQRASLPGGGSEQPTREPAPTAGSPAAPPTVGRPVPAAAAADEETLTLDEARARFRALYEVCQTLNKQAAAMLNSSCDILDIDSRTLTISSRMAWLPERILPGSGPHRHISDAIERVFGRRLDLRVVHKADTIDRLKESPPQRSHLLDEAMKLGLRRVD